MNVFRNKKGIAILSVLLMFTVMMILMGALTIVSVRNVNQSKVSSHSIAAFYAAEAGLNMVVNDFVVLNKRTSVSSQQIIDEMHYIINEKYALPTILNTNDGQPVSFKVSFEPINNVDSTAKKYSAMIVCTGSVGSYTRHLKSKSTLNMD